jgi:hypothetical protein
LFRDEDTGEVVQRASKIVGCIAQCQRYGYVDYREADSRPVRDVLIEVESKFAANRWRRAVEEASNTGSQVADMLVSPIELSVDVAELVVQCATSSVVPPGDRIRTRDGCAIEQATSKRCSPTRYGSGDCEVAVAYLVRRPANETDSRLTIGL